MDPKASAKSKRSHTLHGRRAHQHHPPPPSAASHKPKPVDPPPHQQQPRPPKPSLPSNWHRYEEEDDGEEQQKPGASAAASATPKPKAKGADFSFLLQQSRDTARPSPSFDDAVPDFIRGLSPFALQRGRSLLLSFGDDDFIVDDDTSSTLEVPFLSIDLHAMGSQLEKLTLSQRLFIDADYLEEKQVREDKTQPEESCTSDLSVEKPPQHSESRSGDNNAKQTAKKPLVTPKMEGVSILETYSTEGKEHASVPSSVENYDDGMQSHGPALLNDPKSTLRSMPNRTSSGFKASSAEAELDMLLDSLGQINFPDASTFENTSYDPAISRQSGGYHPSSSVGFLHFREDIGSASPSVLGRTTISSNVISEKSHTSSSRNTTDYGRALTGHAATTTDHDHSSTGHGVTTAFLDDTIDDLLMQTSTNVGNEKNLSLTGKKEGKQPLSISQALDDLDSLLDGL